MTEQKMKPGWRLVKLGEVVCHIKDKVADLSDAGISHYVPGGGIHDDHFQITEWLSVDDGLMGPAFHMRFLPGHTLYKSRVPHGVAVADIECIIRAKPISDSGACRSLIPFHADQ